MSNGNELLKIFQRIQDRLNSGTVSFQQMSQFIQDCADAEEKVAAIYRSIIPPEQEKPDFLYSQLLKIIIQESILHQELAVELRNQICEPAKSFEKSILDQQKAFKKSIAKDVKSIEKAVSDAEKAHQNADQTREKLVGLEGSKRESQQRRIQKAATEYQTKANISDKIAIQIQSTSIPKIHSEFGLFDSNRLSKMQILSQTFGALKRSTCTAINDSHEQIIGKIAAYDAQDRSSRYVSRIFDPTLTELNDEAEAKEVHYVAISDFRSEDPGDLTFERGDEIKVLLQHSSGWWEGELHNKKGRFPKTFVELPGTTSYNTLIGAIFLVKRNHKKSGDITLLSGDLAYVEYLNRDRCSGINLRTKQHGFFPLTCLEITPIDGYPHS